MLGSGVDPPVGPAREHTAQRPPDQEFLKVLGPLTQGELFFPPPFDYASTSVLAANEESGRFALRLFEHLCRKARLRYDVTISVRNEDTPHLTPRTIVSHTANGPEVLAALIAGLLMELEAAEFPEEGTVEGSSRHG